MRHYTNGSALIIALTISAVLLGVGAHTLIHLQNRYRLAHQVAGWEEALLAAEGGVDIGVNALRTSLMDPDLAWQAWNQSSEESLDGEITDLSQTHLGPVTGATFVTSTVLVRQTEGGARSWFEVQIDAPPQLKAADGTQWFRVRSLGIAELPGSGVVAGEKADLRLRRFDLVQNHLTGRRALRPQATRAIEAIVKPVSPFRSGALIAAESIEMNNHNVVVDSYDSRDPEKSNFDPAHPEIYGTYNPAERQSNGNVATNGQLIDAGSAHIYGGVASNGGQILDTKNVTGEIRSDFYQELLPVTAPTLTPEPGSPTLVRQSVELQALSNRIANYVFTSVQLGGSDTIRIKADPSGAESCATIVITGNASITGLAKLTMDPKVSVRIFVIGDASFGGGGLVNPGSPLNLQIYGCEHSDGSTGKLAVGGNGGFSAAIYAPNYNVTLVGGGTTDSIFGAVVAKTITLVGTQSIHYDEALQGGLINDYKIAHWFEYSL